MMIVRLNDTLRMSEGSVCKSRARTFGFTYSVNTNIYSTCCMVYLTSNLMKGMEGGTGLSKE